MRSSTCISRHGMWSRTLHSRCKPAAIYVCGYTALHRRSRARFLIIVASCLFCSILWWNVHPIVHLNLRVLNREMRAKTRRVILRKCGGEPKPGIEVSLNRDMFVRVANVQQARIVSARQGEVWISRDQIYQKAEIRLR